MNASYSGRALRGLLMACSGLVIAACAKTEAPMPAATAAPALKLPVSLNEVMAALVNHSADPIWIAEHTPPTDDKGWRDIERHAMQLQVAGALLIIPGTGPMDEEWTARPEWQGFAKALSKSGEGAVSAVRARDHRQDARAPSACLRRG